MSVPAIAFYSSTANGIGLGSHHFGQFGSSHGHLDCYPNTRNSPATAAVSSCYGQRPMVGGVSCLVSSSSFRHASAPKLSFSSDLGLPRLERHNELGTSFSRSPRSFSFKCRDQSTVNVFLSPVSCSGGEKTGATSSSRISREWSDLRSGRDRIFNGFVRNALGSCLDYGSSTIPLPGADSDLGTEDFPFLLSDSMCEEESYARDLLSGAKSRHIIFNDDLVVKAFYEAEKAHRGQMRMSGDPYLQHCLETALLLAKIGANSTIVAAGLLHDTVDDSYVTSDYIYRQFGADVADLVEGVSKLSQLSKLARENNIASQTVEIDRLHTMFIGMTDTRAVLIKLADRLHNMMTLESLPVVKQQRLAKETLEIFAPLANRLGITSWKEQLENLCFKHLYPEQYNMLCSKLLRCFNQEMVASSVKRLEKTLKDENISYHVLSGRHKSLYSIYLKMLKKNQIIDEIHDIHGLRLIVENEEDCYAALDIVHKLWSKVPGRFKDYIMHPKPNGYKSLHSVVLNENMVPLEVQIRTKEMHLQAEFGFAAHWRYKEGDCQLSSFVLQMVEWARWVVSWQCETMNADQPSSFGDDDSIRPPCPFPSHSDDCPFSYNRHYNHGGPVCIIMLENNKMSVQEFPANSTVMDLLDRVGRGTAQWHAYGFTVKEELRPRLNRELMSNPSQKLMMGDLVELTPAIPEEVLTECREEMQRMYDRDFTVLSS